MSKGEEFLKSRDLIQCRSNPRRQVLGCIACHWSERQNTDLDPQVYGNQITKCTGILRTTVYPILHALEVAGVVTSKLEEDTPGLGHRPRRYYSPAETALGQEFEATLETPTTCNMHLDK